MRVIRCDGSPAAVSALVDALAEALDGGEPVLPVSGELPGELPPAPEGTALVIETSGSTGDAKRVALSAAALRASAAAAHARMGGPGRWLLALPTHHVAGAQVVVRALLAGARPVVLDNREGFRGDRFAEAAAQLSGERRYTSLVPTQLHRVLVDGGAALRALREFDGVLVGGAATPPALLEQARAAGVNAITTYGMTETAGGCVYDGRPLDGVRIRLADGSTEGTGRIAIAGPMLATGYLGRPELTEASFVDGWFHTADLGRFDADGRLRVLGRVDDVITTGGVKVHPAAVERVLSGQPEVREACVVGIDDPEWGQRVAAALVLRSGTAELDAALHARLAAAVRAELGAAATPRLVHALPTLPLRGIGKPDRAEVARLLAVAARSGGTEHD